VAYSPLALTVSSDKLPALSGLADKRRVSTNQKYLAGLGKALSSSIYCGTGTMYPGGYHFLVQLNWPGEHPPGPGPPWMDR
jgi:hypothetical protein